MLHLGKSPGEVAEVMAVTRATVYNWHSRFRAEGLAGLVNRPRSGRPSVADDEEYCRVLEETIDKEPPDLGYAFNIWTINRLRNHLEKETGKSLSYERFRLLLKEKDYRYRRPKHDLHHLQDQDWKSYIRGLGRRNRAPLYGRNDPESGSGAASLLDESWTAEAHPPAG